MKMKNQENPVGIIRRPIFTIPEMAETVLEVNLRHRTNITRGIEIEKPAALHLV